MTSRINHGGLQIADELYRLVNEEIIPGSGVDADRFWLGLEEIITTLGPVNEALLKKRDLLQAQIDRWHHEHSGEWDADAYKQFLVDIGYLVPEGGDFEITTDKVDPEISELAGPQLVVPVSNARFALNAANARWGSLYDAYYGSDIIAEDDGCEKGDRYNPARGVKVVELTARFLNEVVPLAQGSYQ